MWVKTILYEYLLIKPLLTFHVKNQNTFFEIRSIVNIYIKKKTPWPRKFLSIIRKSFFFASSVLRKLVLLTHQSLYVKTWPRKPMKGSICFPIHSQSFEIKHFSHVTSNWIHSCEDTFIHDVVDVISPLFLISSKITPNYVKDCNSFLHFLI